MVAAGGHEVVVRLAGASVALRRPSAVPASAAFVNPAAEVDVSVAVTRKDGDAGRAIGRRRVDVRYRPAPEAEARTAGAALLANRLVRARRDGAELPLPDEVAAFVNPALGAPVLGARRPT